MITVAAPVEVGLVTTGLPLAFLTPILSATPVDVGFVTLGEPEALNPSLDAPVDVGLATLGEPLAVTIL